MHKTNTSRKFGEKINEQNQQVLENPMQVRQVVHRTTEKMMVRRRYRQNRNMETMLESNAAPRGRWTSDWSIVEIRSR